MEEAPGAGGDEVRQDGVRALALPHQSHALGVAAKGSNVPPHPLQQQLLVRDAEVVGDPGARAPVDPAEDAQAEVEVHEDHGVPGGLHDEVAVADLLMARAVLVQAAVEVDDDGHVLVLALGRPDIEVMAVLALGAADARADAGALVVARVVDAAGRPRLLRLGHLEALRHLRVGDPSKDSEVLLVLSNDRPELRVGHWPVRRILDSLASHSMLLGPCTVHLQAALHEGPGIAGRAREGRGQAQGQQQELHAGPVGRGRQETMGSIRRRLWRGPGLARLAPKMA
mmetsp:Transcript_80583/g.213921  ORF Transcript_80583/g.213921 Transcript_80583/m.213921 type:complete len:284 (-) Transcript_80583:1-852(-)